MSHVEQQSREAREIMLVRKFIRHSQIKQKSRKHSHIKITVRCAGTDYVVTSVDFTALGHSSAKMALFSKLVDRGHLVATDGTTR